MPAPVADEERLTQRIVRTTDAMWERVAAGAKERGISYSELVRRAIAEYLTR